MRFTYEEGFQMLKMCNLIRGPKFRREGGGSAEVGQKAQVCGFFLLKPSLTVPTFFSFLGCLWSCHWRADQEMLKISQLFRIM